MAFYAGNMWKHQINNRTAEDRSDKSRFQTIGAFLIHRLQQQKCVQHQPVGVIQLKETGKQKTKEQNKRKTACESKFKAVHAQAVTKSVLFGQLPFPMNCFFFILLQILENL